MPDPRPNILLITSDQHRADALGCAGHPSVDTPHLDLLAFQGTRFDNAYVDCPVCIPARTTLITGRRAHENGMADYAERYRVGRPREHFLGSLLTAAGYQTELVGKTHWHTETDFRGGFEHVTWLSGLKRQQLIETGRAGTLVGMGFNEVSPTRSQFPPHLHSTDWCVDRAMDFLATRERGQPFGLWVSLLDPHPPLTIHEPYFSLYAGAAMPEPVVADWVGTDAEPFDVWCARHITHKRPFTPAQVRRMREVYCGMVANLDHQLGRLLGQLQAAGDLDDTLIVYSSDHGEALGDFGCFGKRTFLECSARVPLIVRPPRGWDAPVGRVSDELVEWADLLPTLCDAAGAAVPDDVTGRSLLPVVQGGSLGDHVMHGQIATSHMLHDGRYKLMYCVDDGSSLCFDTTEDPHDEHPLDGEHPTRLRHMLIEHLEGEGHEHVQDGALANLGRARPDAAELRAKDNFGLGAAQYLAGIERDILPIH